MTDFREECERLEIALATCFVRSERPLTSVVSRIERLGPLRQAMQALNPRCRWLACMLRARISAIDHRHEYAEGGATDAANGEVLCDHHNRFKSQRDYRARRMPNGWWVIHRPDGTPLQPPDAA